MSRPPPFDPAQLGPDDPAPYRHIPAGGDRPRFILICDHASNTVPQHMNNLGLPDAEVQRHIGWDIGAARVTEHLSALLDAPAYLAGYSRLIIDCNRPPGVPTSIPPVSDETEIPANQDVSEAEARARAEAFFWPYHNRVAAALDGLLESGSIPVLVAVHSFTPVMKGFARPWHAGLLWEHDGRLVQPLHDALMALDPSLCIGDNEPYAIRGLSDYSIPEHGQARGLPHIEIELRQDLIGDEDGAKKWAKTLATALNTVYAALTPLRIEHHSRSQI